MSTTPGVGVPVPKMLRSFPPLPLPQSLSINTSTHSNNRHLDPPLHRLPSLPLQSRRVPASPKRKIRRRPVRRIRNLKRQSGPPPPRFPLPSQFHRKRAPRLHIDGDRGIEWCEQEGTELCYGCTFCAEDVAC